MAGEKWPTLPLEELIRNFDSRRVPLKDPDRKPGPFPYYGASGIVDSVNEYIFDGEYLLMKMAKISELAKPLLPLWQLGSSG